MMIENVPNLAKDINLQIQDAKWTPNRKRQTNPHQGISQSKLLKPRQRKGLETSEREMISFL